VAAIFKLCTRVTSGNADSAISKSRKTQKVSIEVWSRNTISYRSNAISIYGLVAAILNFASRRTSDNQSSKWHSEVGYGIKCEVAVAIAASSLPVQNLFPYPVLLAAISVVGQRRAVSSLSSRSRALSKFNTCKEPLESRRNRFYRWKSYFHFRFGGRHRESVVNIIWRRRRSHIQVGGCHRT
jgi:hypothetical protein